MNKKILIIFFVLLFLNSTCFAFWFNKKQKPILVLSSVDPRAKIEAEEKIPNHSVFKIGQRIYFLVYTQDGFKSDYIKYQIVKQDDNAHVGGYSRVRNVTRKVTDKNYYIDYFVLSEAGKYALQIFDIENLHQWIAFGHFRLVGD